MNLGQLLHHQIELTAADRWIAAAWLFVLGSVLGSFMNVVAYRLPRGMSLSHPGSRCPACGHAIRWYDNLPMLGWLRLGGRCRDCAARISPRYPLIELTMAVLCAALVFVLARPSATVEPVLGDAFVLSPGAYALHLILLGVLLVAALIEIDGQQIPQSLPLVVLVIALAIAWLVPGAVASPDSGAADASAPGASLLGAVVGMWLALLAWPAWIGGGSARRLAESLAKGGLCVLVGSCLGVRAVVLIGPATMFFLALSCLASRWSPAAGRLGWCTWLLICTVAQMAAGAWLDALLAGSMGSAQLPQAIGGGLLVMLSALIVRRFAGDAIAKTAR